jgi:hypothetical protein
MDAATVPSTAKADAMPGAQSDIEDGYKLFVDQLFDQLKDSGHARRVATWAGFLLKAIERASDGNMEIGTARQLTFDYRDHCFKARYNHQAAFKGGIEIVEVLGVLGAFEDGTTVATITSLDEAEAVYGSLEQKLDASLAG